VKLVAALLLGLAAPLASALAQDGGAINLGLARRADTSALEITFRGGWGHANGPTFDAVAGVDWAIGHGTPYDILDADVGYSIGFGANKRMCVLVRGGASWWGKNDRTDGFGENVGMGLRYFVSSERGISMDVAWRQFSGFRAPSLTLGLAIR
jgi:hypothetical protein